MNFGLIEESIDNNIINSFQSYEYLVAYDIIKLNNNVSSSIGFVHSQIENYKSDALIFNIKKQFKIKSFNAYIAFENVGLVLDHYTSNNQNNPYKIQFGLDNIYPYNNFNFGYDLVYNQFVSSPIHIVSLSKKFSNYLKFRIANSSNYKKLNAYNNYKDYIYGLSLGFTIYTENNKAIDIGFLNLGPAGYVYGITMNF